MKTTLIHPWENPKGRTLIQEDDELRVLSECCTYVIESVYRDDDGMAWLRCVNCLDLLQRNGDNLWNCVVQRIAPTSNGERWDAWGRDMFGYAVEFNLVIT